MGTEVTLSSCCRTCLTSDCPLVPLSVEDEDSVKFRYKLVACVSDIMWEPEDMTRFICQQCIDQLRIAFDFRNTCLRTNEGLLKAVSEKNAPKNIILNCIETSQEEDIDELATVGDSENPEYLHLKHFLDSEEDIRKDEILVSSRETLSRNISPPPNTEHFLSQYDQSEPIKIAVGDIQEIIVPEDCDESKEPTKLILSNGQEYSIQEIEITEENLVDTLKAERVEYPVAKTDAESGNRQSNVVFVETDSLEQDNDTSDVIDDGDGIVAVVATYESEQKTTPIKRFPSGISNVKVTQKVTKNASSQARPPTPQGKATTCSSNPNTCSICGNTYKKRANLKVHMRLHTGEKPFECKYCDKRFHHSSHLKEHIRRHTGEKPFQCNLCAKRFTIRGELNMHLKSHTGEKPYGCTICDRRCLTATDLKIHLRIHTGEKPYSCDQCQRKFSSPYILSSHLKIHTGERPHVCKVCNKTFTQASHLNVHMKKHTGEKFVCKQCPAEFNHSSQLTVHKREHTGQQPFKCNICDKPCNYASELETHMAKHKGLKFTCDVCSKQFSTNAYLQEHHRVHTGENLFTCKVCIKSFTRQQFLQKHLRTHSGEKPYFCDTCGKRFSQSSSLKVHIRTHTGERPFSCIVCNKTFRTSSDLTVHTRRHKKYTTL